ncbi:hypothetical protein H5398_15695 [Tessaracoccus sp. MC1679]|uniref:hypothetical protein n=1 Tax=Tessaracoccus sp. MC1679 TaxID=2760313 RepID=UPI001600737B|nr:hypothetical protein [Tessaracoccus sp. MC1679]MBB1517398.1 hypothetical protein [Tessaracoccus sp. MC1679]
MTHPPPPTPCPGTHPYGSGTGAKLAWWATRHQLQKPIITILAGTVALATAAIAWPLGALSTASLILLGLATFYGAVAATTVAAHLITLRHWARHGWLVGYFTADASQLVHPEDGVWVLSEHHARRRGRGHGAQLRALLWPHLMGEADRLDAAVRMATRVPMLADQYRAEIPGLVVDRVEAGVVHLMRQSA